MEIPKLKGEPDSEGVNYGIYKASSLFNRVSLCTVIWRRAFLYRRLDFDITD